MLLAYIIYDIFMRFFFTMIIIIIEKKNNITQKLRNEIKEEKNIKGEKEQEK